MKLRYFYFSLIFLLFSCCPKLPELIKDETDLRQDHSFYITDIFREKLLLSTEEQAKMDEDYNKMYFSVWHNLKPAHASPINVSSIFSRFSISPGYGENKRKHSADWLKKLQQNASLENYPNALQPAITTRNTNLRMLPTQRPQFSKPDGNISGWPFDNLQISSVSANTPILLCHKSADKSWALVETSFAFGWIPVEDYARVDKIFIKSWESGRYAVIIKDKTSIFDADDNFCLRTSIGQVFPLVKEATDTLEILVATADENNCAVIKRCFLSRQIVEPKPLPFNYANAVKISNELIDETYGWGGLYGNRDCSAMTRDFFAPFGIWLPRNSTDQAKKAGTYIDLQNLEPKQKEKIILEQGIPYLTLLWFRGHVMLYVGEHNGQALIFHNAWGLKIIDCDGNEGRKIIGKSLITTLYPGTELSRLDPEGLLIKKLSAMTILVQGKENRQIRSSHSENVN
ncbi:MAG: SH3 domain-containing protein [Syntrophaceae bacterium]|nr:SH3 domain-containing protein [Syntrophaceae bacterium]